MMQMYAHLKIWKQKQDILGSKYSADNLIYHDVKIDTCNICFRIIVEFDCNASRPFGRKCTKNQQKSNCVFSFSIVWRGPKKHLKKTIIH